MTKISEREFARLCAGINEDRAAIYKHNPIGTEGETLLWMLLSVLISYLSLKDEEIPCFPGMPTAETYQQAILYVLSKKAETNFDAEPYLNKLTGGENSI